MEAGELARWTRFAAKGGIGKCTATQDCVAERAEDLMFLKGDEVTVLMQIPEEEGLYLGYCEGVVGNFHGSHVKFHSKLKKPIMTKRSSTSTKHSSNSTGGTPSPNFKFDGWAGRESDLSPGSEVGGIRFYVNSPPPGASPLHESSSQAEEPPHPPPGLDTHSPPLPPPFVEPSPDHEPEQNISSGSTTSTSTSIDSVLDTPGGSGYANGNAIGVGEKAPPVPDPVVTLVESPSEAEFDIHENENEHEKLAPSQPTQTAPPAKNETTTAPQRNSTTSINFTYEDPSSIVDTSRISIASDGEVGIGLSLLAGMGMGEGGEWSSEDDSDDEDGTEKKELYGESLDSSAEVPVPPIFPPTAPLTPRTPTTPLTPNTTISSQFSPGFPMSPGSGIGLPPISSLPASILPTSPIIPRAVPIPLASPTSPTGSTKAGFGGRPTSKSVSSTLTVSTVRSGGSGASGSVASRISRAGGGTPGDEEDDMDWEGASDIYENYRYSRYSMSSGSKVSSVYSGRTSMQSGRTPPPLPAERPSMERSLSINSEGSVYSRDSIDGVEGSVIGAGAVVQPLNVIRKGKERPASLKLAPNPILGLGIKDGPSPLLHTSFGSPLTSPGGSGVPLGSAMGSTLEPPLSARSFGAASSLRSRLEGDRSPVEPTPSPVPRVAGEESSRMSRIEGVEGPPSSRGIVVEDDEEPPDVSADRGLGAEDDSFEEGESTESVSTAHQHSQTLQIPNSSSELDLSTASLNPPLSPLSSFPLPPQTQMPEYLRVEKALSSAGSAPGSPSPSPNRTSLFLPHPGAPRATPSPAGPMFARAPLGLHPTSPAARPQPSPSPMQSSFHLNQQHQGGHPTIRALHQAAAAYGVMRRTTIYGRCEVDLYSSEGPVRIAFSMDPPEPPKPLPAAGLGVGGGNPVKSSPLAREMSAIAPGSPVERGLMPQTQTQRDEQIRNGGSSRLLQRPGFVPQATGVRPRSRSFSGFNSQEPANQAIIRGRSREEPLPQSQSQPPSPLSIQHMQPHLNRGSSASAFSASSSDRPSPPTTARPTHTPSPLSMPQNIPSPTSLRSSIKSPASPTSPLASSTSQAPAPVIPPARASSNLRKAASSTALGTPASSPSMQSLRMPRRNLSLVASDAPMPPPSTLSMPPPRRNGSTTQESPLPSPTASSMPRLNRITLQDSAQSQSQGRRQGSIDTVASQTSETQGTSSNPAGVSRTASLRKKLSLPSLRSRSVQLSRQDEPLASPVSVQDNEMVQAENIEFELVRPSMPQASSASGRSSEDSSLGPHVGTPSYPEGRPPIMGHLRPDSPAISLTSGASSAPRSPTLESLPPSKPPTKTSDAETMEAHRQRELKWMSLMSSVPAAQAKKNKKVRKLLMEGVPSSVRYLVWAHLTDSKARGMPGLYAQLGKRGKVPAFSDIERDAQRCYSDQPQLHSAQGTLPSLLQAYLTMVPDIQYETGLTYIAGRLLILAPDEDAFWIFVSLMDTQLRPWFSKNTIQMEVDASLFNRVVEANDAQVAKKLYTDLGITQTAVCRPWLVSLFAQSLPVEYIHRVWDIFLYEGVPFLFRVGMAIIHCCRHLLLQSTSESSALDHLIRPPLACLPSSPEAFIGIALSFKVKDDDVRKQRIKMEAQVKRQTQTRVLTAPGLNGAKPTAISLPKA